MLDLMAREEVFVKPAAWLQFAGGLDLRQNTHDQVDNSWHVDFTDRGTMRPAISVRRLSATIARGPFTVDLGKQFIRWGKADIVTPTDRFAPRDFRMSSTRSISASPRHVASPSSALIRSMRSGRGSRPAASRSSTSDGRRSRRHRSRSRLPAVKPSSPTAHRSVFATATSHDARNTRCRYSTVSTTCRISRRVRRRSPARSRSCAVIRPCDRTAATWRCRRRGSR